MILRKIILNIIFLKVIFGDQQNILRNFNITKPIASKCIKNVVQKTFPCGTLLSIVTTKGDIDSLLSDLNNDNCYNHIVRGYDNHNWLIPVKVYILIATNAAQFSKGLIRLTNDIFWNANAYNIIQLEEQQDGDIKLVFDVLLRYNIFKAILIRRTSDTNITVYTYYPFKGTYCGLKYDYASIGNCDDTNIKRFFSNKPNTLKNCNITIVANRDVQDLMPDGETFTEDGNKMPSLEQYMLETIAEREGIKVHYVLVPKELSFGVVLPNNTATGLLNYLQRDEVDIAAGGIILIKNRMDLFEYIWGYNYATLNLYTPAIGEEIWKDVYKEFSLKTWMLIILAYCTITVMCIIIRRWKERTLQNHASIGLKLWGYLYTNTCKTLAKEKRMRRLMIFWIWFTFFICNFYNTALFSLLTGRDQIKRVITVDDLEHLPFEPCISEATRTYFQFALNKSLPIGRDIPDCKLTDTALDYVASGNDAYAIEIGYIYELNEYKYLDEEGHSKMDAWTFSTYNIIVMYLTRGFPMTREFQDYAWRLYESGILKEHLKILRSMNNPVLAQPHKRHFKKIILPDLRIHFLILASGYLLSILCFLTEMIWHRIM